MVMKLWLTQATIAALTTCAWAQHDSVFSKASNDSLLWGPYRPNLYFGIRPRLAKSLSLGMLWARTDEFDHVAPNIRFTCEQHAGMAGYGWDIYDARRGGVQTIHDKGNNVDIETTLVKTEDGSWAARIKGKPTIKRANTVRTSVWFTIAVDGLGGVHVDNIETGIGPGFPGDVSFTGATADLGQFSLSFVDNATNRHPKHDHPAYAKQPLDRTFVHSFDVPRDAAWQGRKVLFTSVKAHVGEMLDEYTEKNMPPGYQAWTILNEPGTANVHLVQKVFEGPFEFDIIYKPETVAKALTTTGVTQAITSMRTSFDELYDQILKPLAPFDAEKYTGFSKALFSNLVGGIGYFHGDQVIDRSYDPGYDEDNEGFWQEAEEARYRGQQKLEGPYELYTSIPSRPFFPRGFLWDEGFQLLPILDWDMELAMQIISSWYNTMDEDGWIPREQILGPEARAKVPVEFQTQYPHYANPPTLFMAIEALLDKFTVVGAPARTLGNIHATADHFKIWLQALYPKLKQNFDWYRRTQSGEIRTYDRKAFSNKEAYRWRGRTPKHVLTSGLDDYPRALPPHPGELHVDLISWMGMTARTLQRIGAYLEEDEDVRKYAKIEQAIARNIDDLHWDAKEKAYCDATIDDNEDSVHVCHKGYISLFPFMTGIVGAKHEHLKDVLDLIASKEHLWSPHGIRSLSTKDKLYGTAENYWRSPIWMNMNFLIVKNLYEIGTQPGPQKKRAAQLYSALRRNLVNTVYNSWKKTGFAWEQYHPKTGAGQRTQHFTGWTTLVVKILAMPELTKVKDEL